MTPTPEQVLALPMNDEDSGATSVKDYLKRLLRTLWIEKDSFGGKRPFGNSGWSWDLYKPLIEAGYIRGRYDDEGYLEDCDDRAGFALIQAAIEAL